MSTEGTPDPTYEPGEPGGPSEPAGGGAVPTPESSYPPPGYDQAPPYGQQYPQGAPTAGYQQPGYQQPGYRAPAPLSPSDERTWATLAHVAPIVTSFVAPLIIWLVFRERSRFVDDQGKEALNFQIFLAIAYVVGIITAALVIGLLIIFAAWVLSIVFGIRGAIAASRGEPYRYPLTWRVIK